MQCSVCTGPRELVEVLGDVLGDHHPVGTGQDASDARVGIEVFRTAYRQWLAADRDADLAMTIETVMSMLATIVPASPSTASV